MAAITARDLLRQNGFEVGNRGRFNAEQLQFLKDNGFDVIVPVAKPKAIETPISEGSKIRQWARDNSIEVNERGKLSTALKAAYAANDPELAVPIVELKVSSNRTGKPKSDIKAVSTGQVARTTISKPVVRDTNTAYAIDSKGVVIAFGTCGKCNETINRCSDDIPSVPRFMSKLGETFTVQLNRPEKLRHENLTA
jgi:hypothetical protein